MSILLEDFLGLQVSFAKGEDGSITLEADGKQFVTAVSFFPEPGQWLAPDTLPAEPVPLWDTKTAGLSMHLLQDEVPVLYGQPEGDISESEIHLAWDLFGSAFFLLSRYEEALITDFDQHGRIKLDDTIEGRQGFVHRPLVDEYLEILWGCLHHLWPHLSRKPHRFTVEVSCDLDHVFSPGASSFSGMIRKVGGELIQHNNWPQAAVHIQNYFLTRNNDHGVDPYFTALSEMMDANEALGNEITINIKPLQSDDVYDAPIDLDAPAVRKLLKTIHARGHKIGFHPGYNTYDCPEQFNAELTSLQDVLKEEEIDTAVLGGRQHYLRWSSQETAGLWEDAGLQYDSTLGFAEQAGFRCGTSRHFRMYDAKKRQTLNLVQHPLVLMEVSVISDQYAGLGRTATALEAMLKLKEICRFYGGNFTLLWHNSFMRTSWDMDTYKLLCSTAPGVPGPDPV